MSGSWGVLCGIMVDEGYEGLVGVFVPTESEHD
jgi:hypothetical protein